MKHDSTPDQGREVAARAYALWERAGRPEGRDNEFWCQAEQEMGQDEDAGKPVWERLPKAFPPV